VEEETEVIEDEYRRKIGFIGRALRASISEGCSDPAEIISHYEELALLLQSTAMRLFFGPDPHRQSPAYGMNENNMILYEDMVVYDLLSEGWGFRFYSSGLESDANDERLLTSLIHVVLATSLVMAGFDLNKRALEALALHSDLPKVRKIAVNWSQLFGHMADILSPE